MAQYKLTYFNGRGRAEPIRLLLAHATVPFDDNRIEGEQWPAIKPTTPFGQLPTLQHGDFELSQSLVILKYLGSVHAYGGVDLKETARIDELIVAIADLQEAWFNASEEENPEKKEKLQEAWLSSKAPTYMKKFEEALSKNGGFLVGGRPTSADFLFASFCYERLQERPEFLKEFPASNKHQDTILNAEGVKDYVQKRPNTPW